MFWVPEVAIKENSDVLNAFLHSLCIKGYVFDCLIEGKFSFYVIQRSQDNKCWLVSEQWWFDGKKFNNEEYWFNGIDTQEIWEQIIIECLREKDSLLFELNENTLIPRDPESLDFEIQDLLDVTACQANWNLN